MNFDQLRYVIEVSKEKSLSKAARNLHVSTPAVSKAITQLEKEFGITIFNRNREGTTPTLEGKKIIKYAFEILKKTEEIYNEFSPATELKTLRIGCGIALTYVIYEAFLLFNKENPTIDIEIMEMERNDLLEAVKINKIDVGFSQQETSELQRLDIINTVEYEFLFTGYPCVCVSKYSQLYYKEFVTIDDIKDEKFVLYNSELVKSINEQFVANMKPLFTSNNTEVLRSTVLQGHAILIVHNRTFANHPDVLNGDLAIIPLKKPGIDLYSFWGMWSKSGSSIPEAKEFLLKVLQVID